MKPRPASRFWPVVLLPALALTVHAALVYGGIAYTKRLKTVLLAEPSPLAEPAGELAFGRKLAINEARGNWLRVSDGPIAGWVFAGNVSATEPVVAKGVDGLPIFASKTTVTAAARPLSEAATKYATERNLVDAHNDLEWLLTQSSLVTAQDIEEFLKAQKRGEYQ